MKPNLQLRTCLITLLVFVLISISGGPIAKFIDMLGPVLCAVLVMLGLLGWAVCEGLEDLDRRK